MNIGSELERAFNSLPNLEHTFKFDFIHLCSKLGFSHWPFILTNTMALEQNVHATKHTDSETR